jgi:hypothetical protein
MARKVFFAAFGIDEDAYTPEPGPVDRHFVAADLAQSTFGEQSGVSSITIWSSAEDLIADHRQRGPISAGYLLGDESENGAGLAHRSETCPSNPCNRGCADCGTDLNVPGGDVATSPSVPRPSFRDQLSPTMRNALAFEYYEVRPCIERDHQVTSYRDEDEFAAELARGQMSGREFRIFWSLYGVDRSFTTAIGDFVSKDAAHEVMNAILAIPAAARKAIHAGNLTKRSPKITPHAFASSAADWLDDLINQSSNKERI